MEVHHISNTSVWKDLRENGSGGSITGDKFSAKHGDLIIEMTVNREVKVRGRPMQSGYSTDLDARNICEKQSLISETANCFERTHSPSYFFETWSQL